MKLQSLAIFLSATLCSLAAPEVLFNGKDLDGWKIEGAEVWKVEDGMLIGHNGPAKKASILWTEKAYTDFVFQTQFRYNGRIDSGVFLRHENDQIQIGVSGSLKRDMTGSPYIASTRGYPVEAAGVAELLKEGEWNQMKITAVGKLYTIELNGKKVLEYTSETSLEKGPVGLQIHAGLDMKIEFREISLEAR
jgi:hypothetical protein